MQFESFAHQQSALRDAITAAYRRDERECVQALLPQAAMSPEQVASVQDLARRLVTEVRRERTRSSGVDALMHEFSLDSSEGIALMCLAEALLRIPDRETADKLIRDKISRGDWKAHLGNSSSLFVNAAAWGLLVTGKLVSSHSANGLSAAMTRLIAKGGEPLIRKGVDMAMRMLGKQFVTGETIEEALANGREREARGYRFSYDMLGEAAMTEADAQRYLKDYVTAIHAIGKESNGRGIYDGPGISVKLSAIHPRYARLKHERMMTELLPRLKALFLLAKQYNIGLNIDAEEADRLEISMDLVEVLANDADLNGFEGIGIVVQAYQKRCPFVIDFLIDLARRTGHRFMVRLVKGAYWDAEIKRAQVDGLPGYPVYTRKVYTDVSYLACAKKLLAAQDAIYPQFATHNAYSLSAIYNLAAGKDYEFQCLHGMGETLYDQVVGKDKLGKACRIYAPVGSHETLLAYLVRRLLENGANSSFVNRIVDENVSIDELVTDPVAEAAGFSGMPHSKIPLPEALYGEGRRNSKGLDLSSEHVLATLQLGLQASEQQRWAAFPMLGDGDVTDGELQEVRNPADHSDVVGKVIEASAADVERALALSAGIAAAWAATPVAERAASIRRMADLMEAHMPALMGLAVREAGKTLNNAIAEVREAVDFCRYYAAQIVSEFDNASHQPLGPVVCISPWNFPLAIFIGEVVASLAAGNTVLAKPAEQTSLIAAYAVRLLHEAGIPRAALQFLPGRGEVVGAALTGDARIQGVIFTGSTEVAQIINRTLAKRHDDPVLVAETGGMNAMIVDSSALPEQVVTDVLSSAFDSAGQRCSALRVLYLQNDIADKVIAMIKGAMDELTVGNPAKLTTDVGPVIDAEAQAGLLAHIARMKNSARAMHQTKLSAECEQGTFVAPTLFEIDNLSELKREVFGPVLHVLRYAASDLDKVVAEINATGYGLTHGIHSRIDETIADICGKIKVGNIYVNRNIVGAVVGVQPFGGEGKSGTGPKAGGPYYLYRLTRAAWQPKLAAAPAAADLSALDALAAAAKAQGLALDGAIAAAREESPLTHSVALPGPTGENNLLSFAGRGRIGCVADDALALAEQLAAAFAAGNRAVLADNELGRKFASALNGHVSLAADVLEADVDAVLYAGAKAEEARRELAARDGALVPLILRGENGYNVHRLVVERALSVNTTAAGGNASLMSMTE
ncbi:trifunctional transcriptional regulator/proline dehydrogenase/L-glutamate gamma-semialdehyde dehydrogenase [Chromobacterium violaceum]|uniref:trifunctional transcriptional regulator/proline dehydrogenase/L-glutamate gamma-semialdehyde dehydrogenase n=1 Tax=Chromobacterium violaceum TaxID=536 RepID=UPI0009DADD24|nr:trifunctional transcriptional regulator/proline dehydrogenase/L-glutamate gamma-semialdehyde dehydrogenase [Chromobacterium violaceum]OQS11924.1 trifunctional transcriptional regulator/proline dehydrogenase/L-glutamate gamma-semialdehyde dehydrogenase [Chromobacterium violaceum]OQS21194.1 trifunctional transcriptional regulator/proline dehydrogenase/L-glutamate gamma-semialdehyde dehydrogenase [Chromobacterium violaceum]